MFVHLRCTTEYSLTEGMLRLEKALDLAAKNQMPSLAMTDINTVSGAIKFFKSALKPNKDRNHAIAPLLGAQIWVRSQFWPERARVLCLVQNEEGYQKLCALITASFQEAPQAEAAVINLDARSAEDFRGLYVLSGHLDGDVGALLLAGYFDKAQALTKRWQNLLGERYCFELQRAERMGEGAVNDGSLALAQEFGLAVVATHPIMFAEARDFNAHEVRVCIAHDEIYTNPDRPRRHTEQQYFKSAQEMASLFADLPEAISNTLAIARSCHFLFAFLTQKVNTFHMPSFPTPAGLSTDDFMAEQAKTALRARLIRNFPDQEEREKQAPAYFERLEFELAIIVKKGYSGYYLVVAEFIDWARQQAIPVGPGRGSGAGSLVAYVLGITDIDPIANSLLFERFLNPERPSMPDFDIDFCEARRGEVIDHVRELYTNDCVSQIITFMTMGARGAIKDCARALGVSLFAATELASLIPNAPGMTLAKAFADEKQIAALLNKEPQLKEVWDRANDLEGLPRNVGVHAAGILITPKKLTEYCPLYQADADARPAAQFDMKDLETLGLVKFDFLGLSTLTIIHHAVEHIRRITDDPTFSVDDLPALDPTAYRIFQSGDTNAVFQSESRTAKDLERRIHPDNFEEITALMALNRPGPLGSGMVDDYIDVKHGRKEIYVPDERLREILSPTYGVIIYQEQVMQIAQVLANYTLGGADSLRRAIGKKDAAEMEKNKALFIEGAIKNQANAQVAKDLFELIEKFAEYGFNKSHSAAYAVIAYQTAYLKGHYPAAFMSAVMTNEMGGGNAKIANYMSDCRAMGLKVLPPSVNWGQYAFYPKDAETIVFGLGAIKGLGRAAIESLAAERQAHGAYQDFADFLARVDKKVVNKKALESLIKAGACDELGGAYRPYFLASAQHANDDAGDQGGLFGEEETQQQQGIPEHAQQFSKRQNLAWEREVLEFYFSGHMMDFYRPDFRAMRIPTLASFAQLPAGKEVATWVAGMIVSERIRKTAKGLMLSAVLDDGSGVLLDIAVFSKLLDQVRDELKVGKVVLIYGQLAIDDSAGGDDEKFSGMPRIRVEQVMSYRQVLTQAKSVQLPISAMNDLTHLNAITQAPPGNVEIWAKFHIHLAAEGELPALSINSLAKIHRPEGINLTEELLLQWRERYEILSANLPMQENPTVPPTASTIYPEVFFHPLPTPTFKKRWQGKKASAPIES